MTCWSSTSHRASLSIPEPATRPGRWSTGCFPATRRSPGSVRRRGRASCTGSDLGTSGALAVARTQVAYDSLVAQLADRSVGRRYQALSWGHFEAVKGVVDAPVGRSPKDRTRMAVVGSGRPARTGYEVSAAWASPAVSLVTCTLETGRTHQIRVHLSAIGHPLLGDGTYGGERSGLVLDRPFLHAAHLSFDHPATGERLEFDSPLPADLRAGPRWPWRT